MALPKLWKPARLPRLAALLAGSDSVFLVPKFRTGSRKVFRQGFLKAEEDLWGAYIDPLSIFFSMDVNYPEVGSRYPRKFTSYLQTPKILNAAGTGAKNGSVTAGQPRLGQNCTGVPDFQTAFLATLPKKTIKTHPKRLPAAEVQTLTYWGKIFFPNMLVICLNTPHSTS